MQCSAGQHIPAVVAFASAFVALVAGVGSDWDPSPLLAASAQHYGSFVAQELFHDADQRLGISDAAVAATAAE